MKRFKTFIMIICLVIPCFILGMVLTNYAAKDRKGEVVLGEQEGSAGQQGTVTTTPGEQQGTVTTTPGEQQGTVTTTPGEQPGTVTTTPDTGENKTPTVPPKKEEPVKTVFKLEDKGEGVAQIQEKLNKFGYKLEVDGIFGTSTYYAVSDFQSRAKLLCDGVVGPATMEKLNLPPTEEMMYKEEAPVFNPNAQTGTGTTIEEKFINSQNASSRTSYYIYVDTSKPRVNVFTGSVNNWILVRSMSCSIGKSSTPTVTGKFTLGNKGPMFRVDGNIICKYYSQFYGNYLFHTVLLNNQGEVVDGRLGMRISHGCIRLAIEDAKFIYESIPAGTTVWVK